MTDSSQETMEYTDQEQFSRKFFAPESPPVKIDFGASTDVGKVRPQNEDHYVILERRRGSEVLKSSLDPKQLVLSTDHAYAMVVADGMGGTRFGEFASRVALQKMFELASQATSWVMKITDVEEQQLQQRVDAYVQRIHQTLCDYSEADPALSGMGTTWTSAHLLPPYAMVVHLGDSRAYLLRDGQMRQITHDETMAQAFIDAGMEPESVKKFAHILINSFGGGNKDVKAQIRYLTFGPGDKLLLCTDGLTDMVSEDEIKRELQIQSDPQLTCDHLVRRAVDNGGKDNVTVVLATAES